MATFMPFRGQAHIARLGFGLVAAASFAALAGTGCTDSGSNAPTRMDCGLDAFFDSRTGRCVVPQNETQARQLASRSDLEILRDSGDAPVLVEIRFTTPVARDIFSRVITTTQPDSVDTVGIFFADVEDGLQFPVSTANTTPTPDQLIHTSQVVSTARYAARGGTDIEAAGRMDTDFNLGIERYFGMRLTARPSRLLATWEATPEIDYVAVQRGAP